MPEFDQGWTLAERFRRHAGDETHLYGHLMRLTGALALAAAEPPRVDRASAADWLGPAFEAAVATPVVWHSISAMYWPEAVRAEVRRTVAAFARTRPVAVVTMEYEGDGKFPIVRAVFEDGDGTRREAALGTAHPHGVPVRLY